MAKAGSPVIGLVGTNRGGAEAGTRIPHLLPNGISNETVKSQRKSFVVVVKYSPNEAETLIIGSSNYAFKH